jgi:hypothetical protein
MRQGLPASQSRPWTRPSGPLSLPLLASTAPAQKLAKDKDFYSFKERLKFFRGINVWKKNGELESLFELITR